jgi:hypothetical protein
LPDQQANAETSRLDAEWITTTAVRGLLKIASPGNIKHSTYDNALEFAGEIYPELLGPEKSIIRRARESNWAKEYRQRADLQSRRDNTTITPLDLVGSEIRELKGLIKLAESGHGDGPTSADQLRKKLAHLVDAEKELNPVAHTENALIFRDAYIGERNLPTIRSGHGYRDFQLPHGNVLRLRVFHPDAPEHITGADIIYEHHDPAIQRASLIAVQYKIWEDRMLYLSDPRMTRQIGRLKKFLCDNGACTRTDQTAYRFPFCAAFLKPTDKLQSPDQQLISSGEHLPLCQIDACKSVSDRGASVLDYDNMRDISLNSLMFDLLFNRRKIGSRTFTYPELTKLYADHIESLTEDNVVIHAQEIHESDGPGFDEQE